MINKVILIANLGADPETRYMPGGGAVTNFKVATSESYKDKQGKKVENTEWHNIVTFNKLAEICGEYLVKGQKVYLEGSLKTRKWQDKQGNDRWTTEIVCREMQMLGNDKKEPLKQSRMDVDSAELNRNVPDNSEDYDNDIPF